LIANSFGADPPDIPTSAVTARTAGSLHLNATMKLDDAAGAKHFAVCATLPSCYVSLTSNIKILEHQGLRDEICFLTILKP
jgi:hypothetical protein